MTRTSVKGWLIVLTLVTLQSGVMRAQAPCDTAQETPIEIERLETLVHTAAQEARSERRANLVAVTVAGGVLVPTGIVIAQRPDELSRSIGVGLTFSGLIPLAFAALSHSPSPMEKFETRFDARCKSGMLSAISLVSPRRSGGISRESVGIGDVPMAFAGSPWVLPPPRSASASCASGPSAASLEAHSIQLVRCS